MKNKEEINSKSRNYQTGKKLWILAIVSVVIFTFNYFSAIIRSPDERDFLELIVKAVFFGLIFLTSGISGTLFMLKDDQD